MKMPWVVGWLVSRGFGLREEEREVGGINDDTSEMGNVGLEDSRCDEGVGNQTGSFFV